MTMFSSPLMKRWMSASAGIARRLMGETGAWRLMHSITSNEREAANRAEVTALLIRSGVRVYRPEADVQGEDLVLRNPSGGLRSVQLKSRPTVEQARYGGRGIWMLFPDPKFSLGRDWFLTSMMSSTTSKRAGMGKPLFGSRNGATPA